MTMRLPELRPILRPQVPGPGWEKVRSSRRAARVWLLIIAVALPVQPGQFQIGNCAQQQVFTFPAGLEFRDNVQ